MRGRIYTTALALFVGLMALACGSTGTDEGEPDVGPGPGDDGFIFRLEDTTGGDTTPDVSGPGEDTGQPAGDVNGFEYPCEPGAIEACVTACGSAGKRKCLKKWGPCIPPAEFCGNCVDDDCNGLVNEGCPPNPDCDPIEPECPVAIIEIVEGASVDTGTLLHLSGLASYSDAGPIVEWFWSFQAPDGAAGTFQPDDASAEVTFLADVSGQYLFTLTVVDDQGNESCVPAQAAVQANPFPPLEPEIGCADGTREGFLDTDEHPQVAGCAGAWEMPGITPDTVVQTCGGQGGNDGPFPEGTGCAAPDLCAPGWHICSGWQEVAARSTSGCAGAVPTGAKPKSIFFAIRQPSDNGSVCGDWGDGFNDVFGCGNLGAGLGPDKGCGPLDRVLASTQDDSCGFNEAEPSHGPWQCIGDGSDQSHLNEGKWVTKKGCPNMSCQYDGYQVGNSDKGGVLCCTD